MSSLAEAYLEFGLTPAQYHGQLDRLWKALGVTGGPNGEDVFTLAIKAIEQARCKVSSIEGIPDGWVALKFDHSAFGDNWIDEMGQIHSHEADLHSKYKRLIIRKIEKPKQYRPFANAAEFEPHRDRWVRRSHAGRPDAKGCYKVCAYDNWGIFDRGSKVSYEEMFNDGRQFDDGSPFGVEVTS